MRCSLSIQQYLDDIQTEEAKQTTTVASISVVDRQGVQKVTRLLLLGILLHALSL